MNAVTIDVRTKIILLFFTNILLLLHISDGYECLLMIGLGLLFFLEGDRKRALYYVISFLALIILEDYLLSPEYVTSYIALFLVGGRRFLPCFMIGGSILKGSVHEFIVAMLHGICRRAFNCYCRHDALFTNDKRALPNDL